MSKRRAYDSPEYNANRAIVRRGAARCAICNQPLRPGQDIDTHHVDTIDARRAPGLPPDNSLQNLMKLYARDEHGGRVIDRAALLVPKSGGKTELAGAIAVVELVIRPSAMVVIAASSWDQARTLFESTMGVCASPSPLAGLVEVTESEIRLKGTSSKILRVASDGPRNDGLRPTCVIRDEVHEWGTPSREAKYQVLSAGTVKRGGVQLDIATVGRDKDSLLGRIAEYGEQVAAGEIDDPGFLYMYFGGGGQLDGLDLADDDDLREAIRRANPPARGEHAFVNVDRVVRGFRDLQPGRARRYFLNVWGQGGDEQWLPEGAWDKLADPSRVVEPGTEIFLGFDGSMVGDSTALVAVTAAGRHAPRPEIYVLDPDAPPKEPAPEPPSEKPHVFVLGVWQPKDGYIPRDEVGAAVGAAFERYDVQCLWADPFGWLREIQEWEARYGGRRVLPFPTNQRSKWAVSCSLTYTMVKDGGLTHDGNEALARHARNAVPHKSETAERATFGKSHTESKKKIDAAVALTLALHARHETPPPAEMWAFYA
jgi:phage terminase large subunit-like protein